MVGVERLANISPSPSKANSALGGQRCEVAAVLGGDEYPPRARVHRDTQLITETVDSAQDTMQAHLPQHNQLRSDRSSKGRREEGDVESHAEIAGVLPLGQTH